MQGFVADLRQSLRGFIREPVFAAASIVALAIGVGSSTAMFTIVDAVLIRPLPYLAPERLVLLNSVDGTGQRVPMGVVEFFELQRRATTIEAVVQRRRELAVRAALGAQRRQLCALVVVKGLRLAGVGVAIGIAGVLALSRFLSALLYGVGERDPWTLCGVALMLGTVALAATLLPARAAARLDPLTALRTE